MIFFFFHLIYVIITIQHDFVINIHKVPQGELKTDCKNMERMEKIYLIPLMVNLAHFCVPNFEKVGSILVWACPCICPFKKL